MLSFNCVPFLKAADDILQHVEAHKNEQGMWDAAVIDWPSYIALSQSGKCFAFTMHDGERLVGYSIFILSNDLNMKTKMEAHNMAFFIQKEYRGKATLKFIKYTNSYLKSKQISSILYTLRDERVGKLLERKGYKAKYKVWVLENE